MRRAWTVLIVFGVLAFTGSASALDLNDVYIRQASPVDSGEIWIDFEDEAGMLVFDDARIRDNNEIMSGYVIHALEGKKKLTGVRLNNPPYISWITIEAQESETLTLIEQLSLLASFFVGIMAMTAFIRGLNWR